MEKRTSRIRSVRMSKELSDFLDEDSEEQRLTFNALVNRILMKYSQWDRLHDKFGFVTLASETFESILNNCSNETLESMGKELGAKLLSQIAMFWQKNADFEGFLQTFSLYSRYSGLYTLETKKDGPTMVLTFHHEYGVKWSILLRSFVESSLNGVFSNDETRVKYTGNLVFARVKLPTGKDR